MRGRDMAMVFQDPLSALNPCLTVGEQVDELLRVHTTLSRSERAEQRTALFAEMRLPDPAGIARRYPHEISGGQRQRVVIAMALALDASLLIADEPTTALDVRTQAQVLKLLREQQMRRGTGTLFITHDFGVVADIADRVLVMRHGRLVETGPADRVLRAPSHPYTRQLIGAVPKLEPAKAAKALPTGLLPILSVSDIRKSFRADRSWFSRRRVSAVDGVSFHVNKGETLGIVGESGSGKSTLARIVMQLLQQDAGAVRLRATGITDGLDDAEPISRRDIQIVFQDPFTSLNPRRTVGEIIAQGPVNFGVPRDDAIVLAKRLMELVGLDPSAASRFPSEFSGGQRQRIAIARALAPEPKVLVADEPVSALDVTVQAQILDLLDTLKSQLSLTMLCNCSPLRDGVTQG
jgi:peptide/nickel transport system ATP-binding protein